MSHRSFALWWINFSLSLSFELISMHHLNAAGAWRCRSPEAAAIKQKMLYTSSKDYLKKALVGVGKEIQACDYGDLDWTSVLDTLLRTEVAHWQIGGHAAPPSSASVHSRLPRHLFDLSRICCTKSNRQSWASLGTANILVQQICIKYQKNCGFGGKSTKIGTDHAEYTWIDFS